MTEAMVASTVNGTPKVGETVVIRHRTVRKGRDASGVELQICSDHEKRRIAGIYMGTNMIRDHVGENWVVKKAQDGSHWETLY